MNLVINLDVYKMSAAKIEREDDIQASKLNLVSVCRMAVKTLIDVSVFTPMNENCKEVKNFLRILEHILNFGLKGNTKWFGSPETLFFYDYIRYACSNVRQTCVPNVERMDTLSSSRTKGRAWLRLVLMEKRLSEYLTVALSQEKLLRKYYDNFSIMLCDDMKMLCEIFLGLYAIDFSFCLKGEDLEHFPTIIDYSPYLRFTQCVESVQSDVLELTHSLAMMTSADPDNHHHSNSENISCIVENTDISVNDRMKQLEGRYRGLCEQKVYLEDLLRVKDLALQEAAKERVRLLDQLEIAEQRAKVTKDMLKRTVCDLQQQIQADNQLQEISSRRRLETHLLTLGTSTHPTSVNNNILMNELRGSESTNINSHDNTHSTPESNSQSFHTVSLTDSPSTNHTKDKQTAHSDSLKQQRIREKSDSDSMVGLAGSITSENSVHGGESVLMSSVGSADIAID